MQVFLDPRFLFNLAVKIPYIISPWLHPRYPSYGPDLT